MALAPMRGKAMLALLTKHYGFAVVRQRGSHGTLKHPDGRHLTVPEHFRGPDT